jgi:hypothetical protein
LWKGWHFNDPGVLRQNWRIEHFGYILKEMQMSIDALTLTAVTTAIAMTFVVAVLIYRGN